MLNVCDLTKNFLSSKRSKITTSTLFLHISSVFSLQVCEGDKVVIDVENRMEGQAASIHWHGIHQKGTQYSDGVPYVTQCPIQEGNTFRYQWAADNPGTHFWHAHSGNYYF